MIIKAHIRAGSATYLLTVGGMTVSRIVGRSEFSMVRTPDRISDGGHYAKGLNLSICTDIFDYNYTFAKNLQSLLILG